VSGKAEADSYQAMVRPALRVASTPGVCWPGRHPFAGATSKAAESAVQRRLICLRFFGRKILIRKS
jgi:hypothetical protein